MGRWYLRAGAGGLALVKSNGRRVATATWDSVAATVCVRSTTNEDGDERLFPCVALRIGDHEISIGSVTPVERSWPRNVKTVRQAPKYQAEQQHLQWLVQALQAKGTTRGWQW
jgi:hypothetical protein